MKVYGNFINGKFIKPLSKKYLNVLNPYTEKVIAKVPDSNIKDVDLAVNAARKAFDSGVWSDMSVGEHSSYLLKLADLIEKNLLKLAKLESINQGKTIKMARDSDIPFAIDNLRFFAGASRSMKDVTPQDYVDYHEKNHHKPLGTSMIKREPIGVVAAITPWNYPFMIAIWKIGPALAMGNTVIIKPASTTPLTTLELAVLAKKAGIPNGVLNVITGSGQVVGSYLAEHNKVDMISLTGNTETGKEIQRLAINNLKKVHLELGGKAPFIVFEDVDLEAATEGAIVASIVNSGQDCTAATRIYVHSKIYHKFIEKLKHKASKVRLGNPLDKKTDLGPLNSKAHLERVTNFIKNGVKEGAKIYYKGSKPEGKGYFMPIHIMINVDQKSNLCQREIFGPVINILKFNTLGEVIKKANDVDYGLASSVWTKDIKKAFNVTNKLKFGEVWINDHLPLVSEMPHGGVKQTGHGRDLSVYALEEYSNIKHVYVDLSGKVRKPWHYTVYGKP